VLSKKLVIFENGIRIGADTTKVFCLLENLSIIRLRKALRCTKTVLPHVVW
jgi:hypothetical protein